MVGVLGSSPSVDTKNNRDLAQLVAHTSGGREVAGSSPVIPTGKEANRFERLLFYVDKHFLRLNLEQSRNKCRTLCNKSMTYEEGPIDTYSRIDDSSRC